MPDHTSERGAAYLVTLLVMSVTLVLGMSMMAGGMTEIDISGNYRNRASAYYAADSGLDQTLADLRTDTGWITEFLDFYTLVMHDPFPSTVVVTGHTINLNTSGGVVVPDYYALGPAQGLGNAAFAREVYLPPSVDYSGFDPIVTFRTRASGSSGAVETAFQVVRADLNVTVDRYSVWDNAVFANSGHAASLINGHAAIRGSIHIVGDPSTPMSVDFSGTADIKNNYADAVSWFGAGDAAKLPPLNQVDVNGVMVDTIEATVRSEHVDITLSGAAEIGEINDDGNTVKETAYAVYSDAAVTPAGQVFADDWGAYDAHGVNFPSLSDPYTDSLGVNWATHRSFLDSESLTIPVNVINTDIGDFSYSDGNGNSIDWDQSSRTMTISGIVRVDGHIQLGKPNGPPDKRAVNYDGVGTIFSTSDIEITGGLIPINTYVLNDNLGLIAADDIAMESGSHMNVMAAIYAEDEMVVSMQTAVAGALVSDFFDLGSNVPGIFQVPLLASNLPPGMPGEDGIVKVKAVSIDNWFQERS